MRVWSYVKTSWQLPRKALWQLRCLAYWWLVWSQCILLFGRREGRDSGIPRHHEAQDASSLQEKLMKRSTMIYISRGEREAVHSRDGLERPSRLSSCHHRERIAPVSWHWCGCNWQPLTSHGNLAIKASYKKLERHLRQHSTQRKCKRTGADDKSVRKKVYEESVKASKDLG